MSYLKLKLQAERTMALNFEKVLTELHQTMLDTGRSVLSGAQRASGYGSCFFDDYKDVCNQLRQEDLRYLKQLRMLFTRQDIVLEMVEIYFRKKLSRIGDSGIQNIQRLLAEKASDFASGKFSKLAIAQIIALVITQSQDFRQSHIKVINATSSYAVTAFKFYGKFEIATKAARKLRFDDAEYYFDLYNSNLEMFYYLIEPEMAKIIFLKNSGSTSEDQILNLINKILTK
ncbi:hypothetical protein [Pantoea eucalypti]|uniref:hypothetical protein n=1 Tax=Pantoea eucalypti TaxID=470933 RepID=UPI0021B2CC77|nr:hypothetical protein [Pantoea eucalypti]